jgi:hypothetical protein
MELNSVQGMMHSGGRVVAVLVVAVVVAVVNGMLWKGDGLWVYAVN